MVIDTLGNVYLTGGILTPAEQTNNYATMKYNSSGILRWAKIYNGPGSNSVDEAIAVAVDIQGNVYVTGNSEEYGFLTDAYCTIKYDSSGNQLWVARYKNLPNGIDDPTAIAVDNQGNVYVTGSSQSILGMDYLTIKYNTDGDSLWMRRYRGPGTGNPDNYSNSLCLDNQGNVYITGESPGINSGRQVCTIKYNTNGVQQWVVRNDTVRSSGGYKVTVDKLTGDVYVCGYFGGGSFPQYLMVSKISSSGINQWTKCYTGGISETGYDIKVDNLHNIYVVGKAIFTQPSIEEDYVTIKYNSNGDTAWVRRFNLVEGSNYYPAITLDKFNDVYVEGFRLQSTGYEFITLKYDIYGEQKWIMTYPGIGLKVEVDNSLNVFVSGSKSGKDYTTIKYSQPNGVTPISGNIPTKFSLSQNHPNPFNPKSNIKFQIAKLSNVKLAVFDMLGREITTLVNQKLTPGTYEVDFDGSNYPSGVYFYKLVTEDYTEARKMVLLK